MAGCQASAGFSMFSKHCHLNRLTYFPTICTIRPKHKHRNTSGHSLPDDISSARGKMTRITSECNKDRQARSNQHPIANDTSTTAITNPVRRELADFKTELASRIDSGQI